MHAGQMKFMPVLFQMFRGDSQQKRNKKANEKDKNKNLNKQTNKKKLQTLACIRIRLKWGFRIDTTELYVIPVSMNLTFMQGHILFPGGQKASASMAVGKHCSNYHAETEAFIIANRLSSALMSSPSSRHIKTTSSQTWPKTYNRLQLPGGLFYSGFQPTVEYQEMSKRTYWQRRVPEENSMATMSASAKRRLTRALTIPRSQRDDYHLLSQEQQVVLVRLRTGHNRLNSQMNGKLKLASSPTCPFGQEDQTTEHVLQRYPFHKATRKDVWPVSTSLMTKLYGCKQELEKTSFISRAALIV